MEVTKWLKPSVSVPRIGGSCECAGRNASECRASLIWRGESQAEISGSIARSPFVVSVSGSEPACVTPPVYERYPPYIRSPHGAAAPTSRLRRAGLRRTTPFSKSALQPWPASVSSTRIRQNQLGSWEIAESDERAASDGLQSCPFDDDTGAHIFP